MPRHVLGISCYYHDASATLLRDGVVIAAAEEERFSRRKHDARFPQSTIEYCLREAGIGAHEINFVAFYEKPLLKFERILSQHLATWPRSYKTFLAVVPSWFSDKLRVPRQVRRSLGRSVPVAFIEHHLAHAASAFLPSPFSEAAIVTIDGVGEWTTAAWGVGRDNDIVLHEELRFPHSLGLLFSTITAYLGFTVNNSEYKVMGLAAYGSMKRTNNKYYDLLREIVDIKADGSFAFDMRYFQYHFSDRMPSPALEKLLGGPTLPLGGKLTDRHRDIAAAVQLLTEDIVTMILKHVHAKTTLTNIVLAGGVALNSVWNGKILRTTPFERVWIQPNASDGGTSMGAALYADAVLAKQGRRWIMRDAYLGPGFEGEVLQWVRRNGIVYRSFLRDADLIETVAKLIADNYVIGWFQGRMEWGPRALGARSILANPTNPEAQNLLNQKVKHREIFRPFAPAVCWDDAATYFNGDEPMPEACDYMLMVYPVKTQWRPRLPAVTHVDGTGRLQTVRREQNRRFYDLIKAVGRHTGIPMVINTSFNVRGEPIVCTPQDAYRCVMGTEIDYLIIENILIARADNPRDVWNSEVLAQD